MSNIITGITVIYIHFLTSFDSSSKVKQFMKSCFFLYTLYSKIRSLPALASLHFIALMTFIIGFVFVLLLFVFGFALMPFFFLFFFYLILSILCEGLCIVIIVIVIIIMMYRFCR